MENNKEIFNTDNYKFISDFVESKLHVLKENKDFNEKYIRYSDVMDELDKNLPEKHKEQFNEMIKLTYEIEKYYFALAYSFGIKYGEDLKQI